MGILTNAIWGRKAERTLAELRAEYRRLNLVEGMTGFASELAEEDGDGPDPETTDLNEQAVAGRVAIIEKAAEILAFMNNSRRPEKFRQAAREYLEG